MFRRLTDVPVAQGLHYFRHDVRAHDRTGGDKVGIFMCYCDVLSYVRACWVVLGLLTCVRPGS